MAEPQNDSKTAVLQSFRTVDVPGWIGRCMGSVQDWAQSQGWHYLFLDDRFFDLAPPWVRQRCGRNLYAITDVARLVWAQETFSRGYERVIWADADILVFDPDTLTHHVRSVRGHGLARELFLRVAAGNRTVPQWGINNALMVFDRGDPLLADYVQACLDRLRDLRDGEVSRTALGPALLQQLSATRHLNLIDGVGLFTPAMMSSIATGRTPLLRDYLARSTVAPAAANLCHFMRNATAQGERAAFDIQYELAVRRLLESRGDILSGSAVSDAALPP